MDKESWVCVCLGWQLRKAVLPLAVALVPTLVPLNVLGAEAKPDAPPYLRIRVGPSGKRIEGRLVDDDAQHLVLQNHDRESKVRTVRVPRKDIFRLEVRDRPSHRGKGALIGAGVGLGVAAIVGLASRDYSKDAGCLVLCWSKPEQGAAAALLTVPIGSLIGLGVSRGSHWTDVPSPERFTGKAPRRSADGLAAQIVLKF